MASKPDKRFDEILLFSGGVDSLVAWHYLKFPQTLFFDCKSRYSQRELSVVKDLINSTIVDYSLDLSDREYGPRAYIPFRNLLFAAQAVKYSDKIWIAGLADDMVSDKSPLAFSRMSAILSEMENRDVHVKSPFWEMTKADVVAWYLKNTNTNLDIQRLFRTISCYDQDCKTNYCGKCPACFRKWCAFRENGIDELEFENFELMLEYLRKANASNYHPKRNLSIIRQVVSYVRNQKDPSSNDRLGAILDVFLEGIWG